MNKITTALNYIDDDLIFDALQTVSQKKERTERVRIKQPNKPTPVRGGVAVKVKAITISAIALIVCAVVVVLAVITLTPNDLVHDEDPRAHGYEKSLTGFEEIYSMYPDSEMAERLSGVAFENMSVELHYGVSGKQEPDWQDSKNWNSLLFNGHILQDEEIQLHCLFEGTLGEWNELNSSAFMDDGKFNLTFGDTTVYAGYTTRYGNGYYTNFYDGNDVNYHECYAIFERNEVIYEIELFNRSFSYSNADARTSLNCLLEILLGE